ncbi:glycosyltransferase family 4 protein [Sharpea azabuensis]|uniref:Glycosyltransferase family 4 protein n=1 Tax=Sharpea porci TaxID=2652286 RepID=A0A844FR94_9FIRM|nr:glycosyltransferase family 1 protein [Sharpea porci]MST88194.1 glycosyltransferase family 4 protein [Sharpea porci]
MKVLIDLTSLADNFSGIERFALSITKELISNQSRSDIEYILVFKNEVHKDFSEERNNVKRIIVRGKNKLIFNQLQLPLKLATVKADYYFFPAFPAPFFFFNRNAISAIHDVGCWDCPSKNKRYMTLYFKLMYRKVAFGHKKVVTVSQFSKDRISKILKKNPDEIAVIYDGLSDCFANFSYNREQDMKAKEAYRLPKGYILCLSTLEPRKNMKLLVEAFSELTKEKIINTNLVLAGRKGWLMDDLLSNLDKEIVDRIHFTGFVVEDLLPYVYRNAQVFVFPSVYEGFGVPPIEAMSMGIPVISSDAASLPEVLGDAPYYFENRNLKDLKKQIVTVMNLPKEKVELTKKVGVEQAQLFNWKNEALKLRDTLFR